MNATRTVAKDADRPVEACAAGPLVEPSRRRAWPVFTMLLSAVGEGLDRAARYEALAHKTNGELATLGVDRSDLPRFVMFGNG